MEEHIKSPSINLPDAWKVDPPAKTPTLGNPWNKLSSRQKLNKIVIGIGKTIGLLTCLYLFVCSLDMLSLGFRLIGGRTTGKIFRQSSIMKNPVVGVMVGVLTTVLVQSSSTSTSIIVGMVSAEFLTVHVVIPIVMGANIGTSITNTIVSLSQINDRSQFRRAFAAATVHDMFNWLTVLVLLVMEVATGFLEKTSGAIMDNLVGANATRVGKVEILSVITKPTVNLIVQIDKKVLECWSQDTCTKHDKSSLIKQNCATTAKKLLHLNANFSATMTPPSSPFQECSFLFSKLNMGDIVAGCVILLGSLLVLCACLVLLVKILNSVLKDWNALSAQALIIKKTLNAEVPYIPWITGYLAIFMGALMTFLVQSSSVFTSTLTPLVGVGVLTVERVYPLTLGSNVGTTTTALIASMTAKGKSFAPAVQIALCHLLFNVTGIILFYPVPFMRVPIRMAKFLGTTTGKYRWFAIVYMVTMFVALPVLFMGLSFAGTSYVITTAAIICFTFLFVVSVNLLRDQCPTVLPGVLKSWKWLPVWCRSLEPYDLLFSQLSCCGMREINAHQEEGFERNMGPVTTTI